MSLCVATYFSKSWSYSVPSWIDHTSQAVRGSVGTLVICTDDSKECEALAREAGDRFRGWSFFHEIVPVKTDLLEPYSNEAQLLIVRLQQAAFSRARQVGADRFWSVESDVLVPPNALKVSEQALAFDDGYYGIAMVTYFNGAFLGGRGTPARHIAEGVYMDERKIPKELLAKKRKLEKLIKSASPESDLSKEYQAILKSISECPPKGNIFSRQAKKWRLRGWLEDAYPGVGRGAILPTDWVGMGCTLLGEKALGLATYEGYDLNGTQDLFLCWRKWAPAGIRMCVIPHVLCSHVKRGVEAGRRTDEIHVYSPWHEVGGEYDGHPRIGWAKYIPR